ncbi:hypothetical protein [Autumnicola edwardsiae]|uniref:Uncharacterized protein n=1 Tax=Autumnicola edwardsiae TaxID=3075594 RepID=A0ABU3CW48_9FLAO|nr:hypothetical protein [Zunongwangia sp. F297]MDT0650579.1 hypothetical protein [Zunongwangia sp. F297]
MKNIPDNWYLAEQYEGNFIFEDAENKFSVSVDKMGIFTPPYEINFQQLNGTLTKIGFEEDAYSAHAANQEEALEKAYEMMAFISRKMKTESLIP